MSPLWPLAGLLREVIAVPRDPLARDPRFLALVPELVRLLPELASKPQQPRHEPADPWLQTGSRHRVFDAVTRALDLAAEHRPQLLILDDLGRADTASLELLEYLLAELPRLPILLLATLCSDDESAAHPSLARVLAHRNCARLGVQPLREAQVASYVAALLGETDEALCAAVFQKSGGNPLLMTEIVRQLRTRDPAAAAGGTTPAIRGGALGLQTATFALELLERRLARLDDVARDTLTCAAVIGRSFGLPLLQAITGRDAVELMASLDEAVAREIVMPARDCPTQFVFAHDLVRDALYETLDPAQRRAWHLRVARALGARVALGEMPVADLAFHARAALPEGDLRATVRYCVEASDAAARVYAYADAARYLEHARQALDLMQDGSPRFRFALLLRQAAYVRGYSAQEFRPLSERLLVLARELGTGAALAQAAMLLDSFPGFPRLPGSRAALVDALASLPRDEPCARAAVGLRLAICAPLAEQPVAREQLERALALARQSPEMGDRMTAIFAELYLYGGPAHKARAAGSLRELQDICSAHAETFTLPPVLLDIHRALAAAQAGDLPAMTRALARSETRCREFDIELLWHVERFRALARINTGHAAEGRSALLELHQRALRAGLIAGTELFCAYDRSVVLAVGSEDQRTPSERALAPDADDAPNIWALKVRALAASGATDEARNALNRVPAAALTALRCDREYLGTLGALVRAVLALQAHDYGRVLYQLLLPYPEYFAVNLAFLCEGSVSQLLGSLARSFGETSKAREHLDQGIIASEQAGFSACAAEARRERNLC
jgi:hypothetical protein